MIILLLNSHLWEMTDAKYYLYSATLFIYHPLGVITIIIIMKQSTVCVFPCPKVSLLKYTSFNSKLTVTLILSTICLLRLCSTSI